MQRISNQLFVLVTLLFLTCLFLSSGKTDDASGEGEAYEYEYEYEGEAEASIEADGNIKANNSPNNHERKLQSHQEGAGDAKQSRESATTTAAPGTPTPTPDAQHQEADAALAKALQDRLAAEEQERIFIQQRNQGKRGYTPAVANSRMPGNLPKLVNAKLLSTIESTAYCVPAQSWGVFPVVEEKSGAGKAPDHLQAQADKLRKHAQSEAGEALAGAGAGDQDGATDSSEGAGDKGSAQSGHGHAAGKGKKPKKPTFRELQAKKMEERQSKEAARTARKSALIPVGASCEDLLCASCKAVVSEFAGAVQEGGKIAEYVYMEDILTKGGGFCNRKQFDMRYQPIVGSMCKDMISSAAGIAYRDALLVPFEKENDRWEQAQQPTTLRRKTSSICTTVGACTSQQFDIQMTPKNKYQEHWDDKCYVCQAFARDLEQRLHIGKGISEGNVVDIVRGSCDRVDFLTSSFREICKTIAAGKLVDDIAWIAFLHHEAIVAREKTDHLFADRLCETIEYCSKWVDPDAEEIVVQEEVYF
jgi:hypothetical protein